MAKASANIDPGVDITGAGDEVAVATEISPAVVLIEMHRDADAMLGGPVHADVHPLEIANWEAGGWQVIEPEAVS